MSIRLFIADTDLNHIRHIERSVARCCDMRVVGTGANGAQVLRQLSMSPADLLITEVQLPGLDGILLLKDLQQLRVRPAAIVCTHFYSPMCVSRACASGADYFLYKPLDYNRLPEIIRECHRARIAGSTDGAPRREQGPGRAEIVQGLLRELGMPAKLTGSWYLSEAVLAAIEDPSLIRNLSKGLYARLADRSHSTPARLERALRNAIAAACARGELAERFGHRPSNRELLVYLMEQVNRRAGS